VPPLRTAFSQSRTGDLPDHLPQRLFPICHVNVAGNAKPVHGIGSKHSAEAKMPAFLWQGRAFKRDSAGRVLPLENGAFPQPAADPIPCIQSAA